MNNTIAWIIATFIVVTIMMDLSTFILMRINNKAYEQNGSNPRKGKAYWAYLVVSRLALAMTFVAGALIVSIGFIALSNLMAQHKTIATYIITACICLTIASGTWCAIKRDIEREQKIYDANQNADPDELEPFIDPKDQIAVGEISFWLIANIILNGIIITMAVCVAHIWA